MSREEQKIIIVERNILFGEDYFEGFRLAEEVDYESRILSNFITMRRGDAETNSGFKQPIGYAVVMNPSIKKIFVYQRSSKDQEYGEKRLRGKWSWGFGGHIEPLDTANGNPIRESVLREVAGEELKVFGKLEPPEIMGYINYDSDEVGKVHFGVLYFINTNATEAVPKDSEIAQLTLVSLSELERMCSYPEFNVESWSKIALEALRKFYK